MKTLPIEGLETRSRALDEVDTDQVWVEAVRQASGHMERRVSSRPCPGERSQTPIASWFPR